MGPSSVGNVRTDKDEQIENLKICLEANAARTSQLRSRLHATLDTLDALQRAHAQEITYETRTKQKLASKLDYYMLKAKVLEEEKDDLQDAVLQLVEKVELSEDYSSWPRSRLQITSPLEPIVPTAKQHTRRHANEDEFRLYASTLITTLRAERDSERNAHQLTRQKADSKIAILEAQLASREAELEAHVSYSDNGSRSSNGPTAHRQPSPEALRRHSSRVHGRRVQTFYEADFSEHQSPIVRKISTVNRSNTGIITQTGTSEKHEEDQFFAPRASSPLPRFATRTENRHPLLEAPGNMTHNQPPSRPRARSCPPSAFQEATLAPPLGGPSLLPSSSRLHPTSHSSTSETLGVPDSLHVHHDQKNDIAPFDDVNVKREVLFKFLARKRQARSPGSSTNTTNSFSFEPEEEPLRRVVEELRIDLDTTRNAAAIREKALSDEIERLEEHIRSSSLLTKDISHPDPEEEPLLIDMYDGEMSMELGSPLPPATFIHPPSLDQDTSPYDPPSTPLPISPGPYETTHATPSVDGHSLSPLSSTHSDLPLTTLERLEAENRKLRAGESEYNRLQRVVEDLQLQLGRQNSGSPSAPHDL